MSWPARMQYLQNGALADMVIDSGAELWLDGGHNPHAAIAIGNTLAGTRSKTIKTVDTYNRNTQK